MCKCVCVYVHVYLYAFVCVGLYMSLCVCLQGPEEVVSSFGAGVIGGGEHLSVGVVNRTPAFHKSSLCS